MAVEKEECQVVLNARDIAAVKGFDPSRVICPEDGNCNGLRCIFVPESFTGPDGEKLVMSHNKKFMPRKSVVFSAS